MAHFPKTVEDLTPALMTSVLAERNADVVVENVRVIETSQCGDGFASTADRVILGLSYAPGRSGGLPSRLLLKTMLARPHAPEAMYRNEVRFYRDIRPELAIETPRAFASGFDEETGQFGVVMEDLTLRGARFPNAETQIHLDEITGLVRTLAALHARYWASPRFERDLRWLATPCSGGMYPVFNGIGLDLIRDQVEKNEFKAQLIAPLGRSLDQLWDDLWRLQTILASEPTTLLHGDPHIGNSYLLDDEDGGLLDWQLMVRGRWAHDLTYLLVTALSPEARRRHERDLIAGYLEELRARSVEQPPDENAAFLLYRQSVVWGLVIGWLITPPQNYGRAVTSANLTRLVAAAQDLETFRALSE
jgi:hypothetical protein